MKRYTPPKVGKIAYYKKLRAAGYLVIWFHHDEGFTFFGRIWENEYGGGGKLTQLLPYRTLNSGMFVITEEEYNAFLKQSILGKKMTLIEAHGSFACGTEIKIEKIKYPRVLGKRKGHSNQYVPTRRLDLLKFQTDSDANQL